MNEPSPRCEIRVRRSLRGLNHHRACGTRWCCRKVCGCRLGQFVRRAGARSWRLRRRGGSIEPLIGAAYDLQSRIFNILRPDFLETYVRDNAWAARCSAHEHVVGVRSVLRQARLREVQHLVIELIEALDVDHVRYPEERLRLVRPRSSQLLRRNSPGPRSNWLWSKSLLSRKLDMGAVAD
jgi:hypothetical protein